MALKLYYHPFASFCQKVLIALYENGTAFEGEIVDLGDPESRAAFQRVWPLAKFPVLRDEETGLTIPESSSIIEYLAQHRPGSALVPAEPDMGLEVRTWDRIFDHYVQVPMQKVVVDNIRPEGRNDPYGVDEARAALATVYDIIDGHMAGRDWAAGGSFSMADCAAAPALFYANIALPFGDRPHLAAYYQRLLGRPSFARVVEEARPYRTLFPMAWPAGY